MKKISNPTLNGLVLTDRYGQAYSSTKKLKDIDKDIQDNGVKIATQANSALAPVSNAVRVLQQDELDKLKSVQPGQLIIGNANGTITYGGMNEADLVNFRNALNNHDNSISALEDDVNQKIDKLNYDTLKIEAGKYVVTKTDGNLEITDKGPGNYLTKKSVREEIADTKTQISGEIALATKDKIDKIPTDLQRAANTIVIVQPNGNIKASSFNTDLIGQSFFKITNEFKAHIARIKILEDKKEMQKNKYTSNQYRIKLFTYDIVLAYSINIEKITLNPIKVTKNQKLKIEIIPVKLDGTTNVGLPTIVL